LPKELSKEIKNELLEAVEKLPLQRYRSYIELCDEKARLRNIVAYSLLIRVLRDYDIDINISDFSCHKNGKPYFKNSNVKFNISHCDDVIAVAISDDEIGLDVEKIKVVNSNLINKVYSVQEQKTNAEKLLDEDFFCKTWTIKESYVKRDGQGLNIEPSSLSFNLNLDLNKLNDNYINTIKLNDFYLSVCGNQKAYQIQEITIEQLYNLN